MKRLHTLSAWALAALLGLAAAGRAAAPLDNRVPQDALLYFGWAGSDALQPQYAASNLKSFVDASTAPAFIAQQLPKFIELAAKSDPTILPKAEEAVTTLNWKCSTFLERITTDFLARATSLSLLKVPASHLPDDRPHERLKDHAT